MNVVLWILQALLALLYLSGGAYKVFRFDEVAGQFDLLSRSGWSAIGVFEIAGGLLLIVPAALKWWPVLTPFAAAALALEAVALSALYAQHSLKLTVENPLLWSLLMGLVAIFVAYGRFALRPTL